MKQLFLLCSLLLFGSSGLAGQDLITRKTGEDIQAIVLEVGANEVKYRKFDNPEGPIYVLLKKEILMIRYKNGSKDVFIESSQAAPLVDPNEDSVIKTTPAKPEEDWENRGAQDARYNYTGARSGAGWVAATNIVLSPLFGLIPAAACSSSEPLPQNLNAPEPELMNKTKYRNAYTQEAHKIKRRAIWTSYGTSSVVWLLLVVIMY
ncbi:MAG: hypothetical protein ACK5XN_02145 [Bacteroidota bacterium]